MTDPLIFGPYPESDILRPQVLLGTSQTNLLKAYDLVLFRDGECVGLDTTELIGDEARRKLGTNISPVYYKALVKLDPVKHLSVRGQALLSEALFRKNRSAKLLRLEEVTVIILGRKSMTVRFMISDSASPYGMLMKTTDAHLPLARRASPSEAPTERDLEIVSLSIGTYKKSRTYLNHWHFLRVLLQVTETGPKSIPKNIIAQRNMMWFLSHYTFPQDTLSRRRLVYDPKDADIADSRNMVDMIGTLRGRRRLPHFSGLRLLSWLTIHIDWLMSRQDSKRYINVTAWDEERRALRRIKNAALRQGIPFGEDWTQDHDSRLEPESERAVRNKRRRKQNKKSRPEPSRTRNTQVINAPLRNELVTAYDPEYSDETTEEEPGSSDCSDEEVDDELLKLIPKWGIFHPTLADDARWYCSEKSCSYMVDLRYLQPGQVRDLPPEVQDTLRDPHGQWSYADDWVKAVLAVVVYNHWVEHLIQLNIKIYKISTPGRKPEFRFRWKDNQRASPLQQVLHHQPPFERDQSPAY